MAVHASSNDSSRERPEFAVTLGLLPPYTLEDVRRAYLEKVKQAHPDHGGRRDEFDRIQNAYEQANDYLSFRSDRRKWIAARMDEYLAVTSLTAELQTLGADVDTKMHEWVRRSFGDFANLTEAIVGVRLHGSNHAADLIDIMVGAQAVLPGLKWLDLAGCNVDDALALQLRVFKQLVSVDLSNTSISSQALALAEWLPALIVLKVEGTSVGWWARRQLAHSLRRHRKSAPDPAFHPASIRKR